MKILVTGAFGWTAEAIIQGLRQADHEIFAFDLPTAVCPPQIRPLISGVCLGDVAQIEQVDEAVHAADAIVHLAVAVGDGDYQSPDIPFKTNVQGTYNIFEAARRHNVQKTILMSSAAVHLPHAAGEKISAVDHWVSSYGEDHFYDLTKYLQEVIAKDFCRTFGMSAITLRAGHIVDGRREVDPAGRNLSSLDYCRGGWVCRYDLAAASVKAVALQSSGYNAFHVIGSYQARQRFDIDRTEKQLGLNFESLFERYASESDHK